MLCCCWNGGTHRDPHSLAAQGALPTVGSARMMGTNVLQRFSSEGIIRRAKSPGESFGVRMRRHAVGAPASDQPKVFISYSHDSRGQCDRVLALSDRLRDDGVDCILDQYEMSPPEGWPRWMDKQIRDADFVLMVCTETYYRRVMGEEEPGKGLGVRWEGHLSYEHFYEAGALNTKFVPVLFEDCKPEHIPSPFASATYFHVDTEEGYEDLYRLLTYQLRTLKPELGKLRSLPPRERRLDPLAKPWNVPLPRNPFFTGREGILSQLRDTLESQGRGAVSGLGGVGKTQIAVEYAYRHRDTYSAVLWSQAHSREAITLGFIAIARLLNLPTAEEADQGVVVAGVKRWLEDHSDWLLVFDNADKPELVKDFLPPAPEGHILFTSRAQVFQALGIAKPTEITKMHPEEALEFLFKRTGREEEPGEGKAAEELAHELAYLPLALEQAAAYITELGALFQDHVVSYRKRRLELLEESGPVTGDYPESVATTWLMNFEQVEKASQASADLLRVSAFLSPDSIPVELISEGASELGPALSAALANVKDDPLLLDKVLEPLTRYCLVRRDLDSRTYSIHRLVQEVTRDEMDEDTRRVWAERVVHGVDQTFPPVEFANWPLIDGLLPHAKRASELIEQWNFESEEAARLLNQLACYLDDRAQYAEAEPLYERALAMSEKALGSDHPDVATTLNNLAELYQDQGKYAEAAALYQRALAISEKALGPDHPSVATTLNNLAELYRAQGKYAEAEPLYQRDLAISEKALGPDHPSVAATLNNLAELYRAQGKYAQAEPLYRRTLGVNEEALGPDHPSVATTLNNLALLYRAQGKYAEAEPLYQRALAVFEEALGPEHPSVATVLENYAHLLRGTKRDEEAEQLEARTKAIRAKREHENPTD